MKKVFLLLTLACAWVCLPTFADTSDSCAVDALDQTEEVYDSANLDVMPQFPGGETALYQWIASHIQVPEAAAEAGASGRVLVEFVISKTGSIEDVKVLRSVHPALDKEAMRVIKSMPKWDPGRIGDRPVRVTYRLPLTFNFGKK